MNEVLWLRWIFISEKMLYMYIFSWVNIFYPYFQIKQSLFLRKQAGFSPPKGCPKNIYYSAKKIIQCEIRLNESIHLIYHRVHLFAASNLSGNAKSTINWLAGPKIKMQFSLEKPAQLIKELKISKFIPEFRVPYHNFLIYHIA